jgi:hypothetical protein
VRKPALLEPVAHHEAGLAAADNQSFDPLDLHRRRIDEIDGGGQSLFRSDEIGTGL